MVMTRREEEEEEKTEYKSEQKQQQWDGKMSKPSLVHTQGR